MKITKYIVMSLAIAVFSSCGNDDDITSAWQNDPAAIKINARVGKGIFCRSNPLSSDEATQRKFNDGDKISITAGTQSSVTYTLNEGTWTPETGKYLKWETNTLDISAYYPVTDGTSSQSFTLPTDQSDETKLVAADYMTYSGSQDKPTTGGDLTIEMSRKMSRVIVKITKFNNQFGNDIPKITDVRINSGAAGYASGLISGNVTDVTPYADNLNGNDAQVGTTYTALVIPTDAKANESFIDMSVNGTSLIVNSIPPMEAGKSYTYNLTIGKDTITVGDVTVTEWDPKKINGGEAILFRTFASSDYYMWDAYQPYQNISEGEWGENSSWHNSSFRNASASCLSCPSKDDMIKYINAGKVYWDGGFGDVSNGLQTYFTPKNDTQIGSMEIQENHAGIWLLKQSEWTETTY